VVRSSRCAGKWQWRIHGEEATVPAQLPLLKKEEQHGEAEVLCGQSEEARLGASACGQATAPAVVVLVEMCFVWAQEAEEDIQVPAPGPQPEQAQHPLQWLLMVSWPSFLLSSS